LPYYVYSTPPLIEADSTADIGFSGTPDNTDPFASGQQVTYTVQSALSEGTTYYWRVRPRDPSGTKRHGLWSITSAFNIVGSPLVSVNDAITVTDVPTIVIPTLKPSVFDAITVADVPTIVIPTLKPSIFDTITITEDVSLFVYYPKYDLSVYDSITVADKPVVPIGEDITITDVITIKIVTLLVDVFDSIAVTDVPAVEVPTLDVSVFDAITVTDEPTIVILELNISVFDAITVTDVPTAVITSLISTTDI
jgi:hypothetical protein